MNRNGFQTYMQIMPEAIYNHYTRDTILTAKTSLVPKFPIIYHIRIRQLSVNFLSIPFVCEQ